MKQLIDYAGTRSNHSDEAILDRITEQFGSELQGLTCDDKASLLICLVEAAINPQQVLTEPNFYSDQNGGEAWLLAQGLSSKNQLTLALAVLNQIICGGQ